MFRFRFLIINSVLALTLIATVYGRNLENASATRTDFLRPQSYPFRDWHTTDIPLSKGDLALLQPDAVLVRQYKAKNGEWAELAVTAGHRKRSVHTPGFCMVGGGWEMLSQRKYEMQVAGRTVPCIRAVVSKDGQKLVLTYLFTDGDYFTNNLVQFQGNQLLRRFGTRVPVGAMVRLLVPAGDDLQESERFADEFGATVLPGVFRTLHDVQVASR